MNLWKIVALVSTTALVVVVGSSAIPSAHAEKQGQMQKALEMLEKANDHLGKATADKGGHRVKAMEHTKAAIEEVKKGIAFDDKH